MRLAVARHQPSSRLRAGHIQAYVSWRATNSFRPGTSSAYGAILVSCDGRFCYVLQTDGRMPTTPNTRARLTRDVPVRPIAATVKTRRDVSRTIDLLTLRMLTERLARFRPQWRHRSCANNELVPDRVRGRPSAPGRASNRNALSLRTHCARQRNSRLSTVVGPPIFYCKCIERTPTRVV
jgi:hypothetical protein